MKSISQLWSLIRIRGKTMGPFLICSNFVFISWYISNEPSMRKSHLNKFNSFNSIQTQLWLFWKGMFGKCIYASIEVSGRRVVWTCSFSSIKFVLEFERWRTAFADVAPLLSFSWKCSTRILAPTERMIIPTMDTIIQVNTTWAVWSYFSFFEVWGLSFIPEENMHFLWPMNCTKAC